MGQWEYTNVVITTENRQYVMSFTDGLKLVGLNVIMNHWAASGWELVTLVPTNYEGSAGAFGTSRLYASQLIATFKRPRQTTQQGRISGPFGAQEM